MKEKKNILLVIFAVALVSLITAVIAGFFDSIFVLADKGRLSWSYDGDGYIIKVGVFELITSIFGIAFCTFYILGFFMKKSEWLTISQYVSGGVLSGFFVVTFIVLRAAMPKGATYYTMFAACFNILLSIIVSAVLVFVSAFFIEYFKKMEQTEEKQAEQQALEEEIIDI